MISSTRAQLASSAYLLSRAQMILTYRALYCVQLSYRERILDLDSMAATIKD